MNRDTHQAASGSPGKLIFRQPLDRQGNIMKTLMIAALLSAAATTSAFAQSAPAQDGTQQAYTAQASANATAVQNGAWVPPDGQAIAPKTRAQVYQELVQAEQDGQLAYLNSTVYAHP